MIRIAPLEEFYELYEQAIQVPVENELDGFHQRVRSVQSSLVSEFENIGLVENVDFVMAGTAGHGISSAARSRISDLFRKI